MTLVELMLGLVCASILAMVMGSMLYFVQKNWVTNNRRVELQRDASLVMDMLTRRVRRSTATRVTVTGGGKKIKIKPEDTVVDPIVQIYRQGQDLIYDPDVNVAGDEMVLIEGKVKGNGFRAENFDTHVRVDLQLEDQDDNELTRRMHSMITFRN